MDKAQLSEIRARLRAAAERESRPQRTLMPTLRSRPAPEPAAPRPHVAARRVGLNPTYLGQDEDLIQPLESSRGPFGQRTELRPPPEPPLLLLAPPVDEPEPQWTPVLPRRTAAAAVSETPYHPEDFSDPAEGEAERLYAAAGLAPIAPRRPRSWIIPVRPEPAPEPSPAPVTPEQELLAHLERVFLAEQAAIEARRL